MNKKTRNRDSERAALTPKVARITGYSEELVKKVIRDERQNELILNTYMDLKETLNERENYLLAAVKNLIPFPTNNQKTEAI
jgi:hypothetical protein